MKEGKQFKTNVNHRTQTGFEHIQTILYWTVEGKPQFRKSDGKDIYSVT
jgi:hypothetical protein